MIGSLIALSLFAVDPPAPDPTPEPLVAPSAAKAAAKAPKIEAKASLDFSSDDAQALYRSSLGYLARRQTGRAIRTLRELVKIVPDSIDAKLLLAQALRQGNEAEDARLVIDELVQEHPEDASVHAERGLLAWVLKESDVAIAEFTKASTLSPEDPELRFNLGESLEKRGRTDEAVIAYREALRLKPDLVVAKVNLGKALAEKGQLAEAEQLLIDAANHSRDAEAYYNLGVLRARQGKTDAAIEAYREALAVDGTHALAHNNLGVALDSQGDHADAVVELKKAIETDPNYAEAYFNLGLSYFQSGENTPAIKMFEKALALEPRRASGPYLQLGSLYLGQGRKERAVEAFKKALAAAKEDGHPNSDAYRGLALAYLALGSPEQAIDTLKSAVSDFPKDPSAHEALGRAYVAKGDLDAAVVELGKRLELDATTDAKIELARVWAQKRVGSKAEPLYLDVLKADAQNRAARLGLVDLYIAIGRWPEAEKILQDVASANPDDAVTSSRLGILHSRKGRPDLAVPELEQATKKDPTQLEAKAELGFLYLRGGDTDAALRVLGQVLTAEPRQPYALLYLGHALYRKGLAQKAEESFKASAQVDPAFGEPHFALGQLYEAQNKLADARREYETAAKLQQDHPEAAAAAKRLADSGVR